MLKGSVKWWGIPLVFMLPAIALGLKGCFDFSTDPQKVDAFFKQHDLERDDVTFSFEGQTMHYVRAGDPKLPLVLFVHGSPGSWDAFMHFFGDAEIRQHAQIASVDRPGFGGSGRGRAERSLAKQAAAINEVVARIDRPVIMVGHSLGGPVIAKMAMDHPARIAGLIMVAPSIDPALEKTKWFQIPGNWKVFSWLVPKDLRTANREILPLKGELEAMVPAWARLTMPVTVIQGGKDKLVPPGNADFAEKMLRNASKTMVRIPDMNHFVPWTHPHLIREAILTHLKRLESDPTTKVK